MNQQRSIPEVLASKAISLPSGDEVVASCYRHESSAILEVTITFRTLKHVDKLSYPYRAPEEQIEVIKAKVEAFSIESAYLHLDRIAQEIQAANQLNAALEKSLQPTQSVDWETLRRQHSKW